MAADNQAVGIAEGQYWGQYCNPYYAFVGISFEGVLRSWDTACDHCSLAGGSHHIGLAAGVWLEIGRSHHFPVKDQFAEDPMEPLKY